MAKGKSQETEVQRVVLRPLASIKPNPKNPRISDPEGLENLCESIKANPAFFNARPILLSDRTGELVIIGGERRSEAAKRLGMTEVPTILLSGLNEAQEDEIMVRDNTHNGKWDEKMLKGWPDDVLKKWCAPPQFRSSIDISGLFRQEEKKPEQKYFEIKVIVPPTGYDIEEIKMAIATALEGFDGIELK